MDEFTLYKTAILLTLPIAVVTSFIVLKSKRKELTLALGAVAISLWVGELFVGAFFPQLSEHDQMFVHDAELGWSFIPNKSARIVYRGEVDHRIKINANGFRDVERDLAKGSKRRVLVLGDSFVSNISVEADEVFTRVIERDLSETEVFNFGVNGYGQVQEYLLLDRWFERVKPDVVMLVVYVRNDFLDNVDKTWTYSRPVVSLEGPDSALVVHSATPENTGVDRISRWRFYERSHIYALFNRALDGLLHRLGYGIQATTYAPPELYLCKKDPAPDTQQMFAVMKKLLLKFQDFASAKGVRFVTVLAPSHVQVYDDLWLAVTGEETQAEYDRSLPNKQLMQFAQDNQLMILDLLPILRSEGMNNKGLYYHDEQHWTRQGNQLMARTLVEYLKSAGLAN